MSKSPETVSKFLTELAEKLKPLWTKEKAKMIELKEEEVWLVWLLHLSIFWISNLDNPLIESSKFVCWRFLVNGYEAGNKY